MIFFSALAVLACKERRKIVCLMLCSYCVKLGCRWTIYHQFTDLSLAVHRADGAHRLVVWYLASPMVQRLVKTASFQSSMTMAVPWLCGTVVMFMTEMDLFLSSNNLDSVFLLVSLSCVICQQLAGITFYYEDL